MEESLRNKAKAALQALDPANNNATLEQKSEAWRFINEMVCLFFGDDEKMKKIKMKG